MLCWVEKQASELADGEASMHISQIPNHTSTTDTCYRSGYTSRLPAPAGLQVLVVQRRDALIQEHVEITLNSPSDARATEITERSTTTATVPCAVHTVHLRHHHRHLQRIHFVCPGAGAVAKARCAVRLRPLGHSRRAVAGVRSWWREHTRLGPCGQRPALFQVAGVELTSATACAQRLAHLCSAQTGTRMNYAGTSTRRQCSPSHGSILIRNTTSTPSCLTC